MNEGVTLEFLGWHPLVALAAAAAAGALAVLLRRAELPALAPRRRVGLIALRLAALLTLAALLAEPTLAWHDRRHEAPAVAVVVDRSGSMALADPALDPGARLAEAAALGLIAPHLRPDAAARAASLARRAARLPPATLAAEARALADELAGQPRLAAALAELAAAPRRDPAALAALVALAERAQADADRALAAAPGAELAAVLDRVAALSRRDRAAALAERLAERLPGAALDWFALDERLVPVAGPAGLRAALAGEAGTDLGEGLAALARGWAGRGHPAACLLLSDGRRTAGADPAPAARALAARGVRLLAVAVGDPTPPPDVAVAALDAPGEVVRGEQVRLTASVRVPPGAGAWELAWLRDGAEAGRTPVAPAAGWQRLAAAFPAGEPGVVLWEARLTPATGEARGNGWLREVWTGLASPTPESLRADPRWPDHPDERAVVASALAVDARPARGDRLRAWLLPPRDGEYTLWLSGDDQGELLLAEDGDPAHARPVATIARWCRPGEWEAQPGQRSAPVVLRLDRPAYLEAVLVNHVGPSHLAVGWTRPDGAVERPLPLPALVPWSAAGPPARGARREATTANNAAARAVAIAEAPPRLLAIDSAPRWELRHALAALAAGLGARIEQRYRNVLGPGATLVPAPAVLAEIDMLLLGDLPPAELGADEQARLSAFVARRGGFLVVVSGARAMPAAYGLGPLAALLPVRGAADTGLPEADPPAVAGPALARLLPGFDPAWELLPPLPWRVRGALPRPGAEVALALRDRAGSPLLVCAEHGAGRVAWLGSDELWRWRAAGPEDAHAALWLRLARWGLGARLSGGDRRLLVALDRAVAAPGQAAGLRLRALGADGAPAPAPEVALERLGVDGRPIPGTRRALGLLPVADLPGTWNAVANDAARPLPEGRWRLTAALPDGGSEARDLLVRADPGRELLEPALDRAALDRLAAAGGGEAVGMAELDAAIAELAARLQPRTVAVRRRLSAWDGPWWLLLFAALLAAEWAWRRRAGLP